MKQNFFLTILFTSLLLARNSFAQTYTLHRIIDGKTIELSQGKTVKLIGTLLPRHVKLRQAVMEHAKSLGSKNTEVRLEYDEHKTDKQGNTLAYVYYSLAENGEPYPDCYVIDQNKKELFVNASLFSCGYSQINHISENRKYMPLFGKLYKEAYEDQRGMFQNIVEGIRDGTYVDYFNNRNLRQELTYKDQKLMQFKTYYKNGKLKREDNYNYGVRHGLSISMDMDGNVKGQQEYENGKLIESQWFDKNGNITTYLEKDVKSAKEINAGYVLTVGEACWPALFEDGNITKELKNTIIKDINNVHDQLSNYAVIKHVAARGQVAIGAESFDFIGSVHLGDDDNYSLCPDIFWRKNLMRLIVKDGYDTVVIPKIISDEYKRMGSFWNNHKKEFKKLKIFTTAFNNFKSVDDLTAREKKNLFYLQFGRSESKPKKLEEMLLTELLKSKLAYRSIIHKCSYYENLIKDNFKNNPKATETFLNISGADQISLICEVPFIDRSSKVFSNNGLPLVYADSEWHFYLTDMGE